MMHLSKNLAFTTLITFLSCGISSAGIITGVTATADSTFAGGGNLQPAVLVNGNGFNAPFDLSSTHSESGSSQGQWHTAVGVTGDTDVTFDLNGVYDLGTAHIWQHNQTGLFGRGVNQFDILVSSNGTDYTEVLSDSTLDISTGGDISAQTKAFSASNVSHVRFRIDSNHGDQDVVGLSEVRFEMAAPAAVPEPSSIAIFGALGILLCSRRRRTVRKTHVA